MIVLAMLTLFAILGLSFVLYANSQAQSARLARDAEGITLQAGDIPDPLFNYFLGQLIYDTDNSSGVYSAMRGHSLARALYGYNDAPNAAGASPINIVPFCGTGRLHIPSLVLGGTYFEDQLINHTYFQTDGFVRDPEWTLSRPFVAPPPYATPPPTPPHPAGSVYYALNAPYTYADINNMYLAAVKPDGTVLLPSFHRPWTGFGSLDPSNPNWTSTSDPSLKYKVLRPRPADMDPSFPLPTDAGGDVKNLVGAPGGSDSIWIDLGYPVQTKSDGTKYKPLFAPLIMDLDGRVNVNTHGNILGWTRAGFTPSFAPPSVAPPTTHISNQGWGPWTVNLQYAFNAINPSNPSTEWVNLFDGQTNGSVGRYGFGTPNPAYPPTLPQYFAFPDLPSSLTSYPAFYASPAAGLWQFPSPHFYAPVDYDECQSAGSSPGASTQVLTTPPNPLIGSGQYNCFPSFPGQPSMPPTFGYDNPGANSQAELVNHPGIYNYFQPQGDDRVFADTNLEPILRMGDAGVTNLPSDFVNLMPNTFSSNGQVADPNNLRNLITTRSFDLDRPGLTPWAVSATSYNLTGSTPTASGFVPSYPKGNPVGFQSTSNALPNPPGEYQDFFVNNSNLSLMANPGWRAAAMAALGKIDLNRSLPEYPFAGYSNSGTWQYDGSMQGNITQFLVAQTARQDFARDIFTVLLEVTTGYNDVTQFAPTQGNNGQYNAARWLAQLAVNIVDFVDDDDIMTPFFWYASPNQQPSNTDVVFGTELPHVLLNEAYADYLTVCKTVGTTTTPQYVDVKVWVELVNPFKNDASSPVSASISGTVVNGAAQLYRPGDANDTSSWNIYQVLLTQSETCPQTHAGANYYLSGNLRSALNPWGTPFAVTTVSGSTVDLTQKTTNGGSTPAGAYSATTFATNPYIGPLGGGMTEPANGYYVVGPVTPTTVGSGLTGPPPNKVTSYALPPGLPAAPDSNPGTSPTAGDMEYQVLMQSGDNGTTFYPPESPGVVLQRLACPYLMTTDVASGVQGLPNNTITFVNGVAYVNVNGTNRVYNPYVTVDYMADISIDPTSTDGSNYYQFLNKYNSSDGVSTGGANGSRASTGRNEPYVGHFNYLEDPRAIPPGSIPPWRQNQVPQGGATANVNHTFGQGNNPVINQGFNWLTQFDRPLASPADLLHVSGVKPCELTQEFINPAPSPAVTMKPFNHRIPWFDEDIVGAGGTGSHFLYRFFEFAGVRGRGLATSPLQPTLTAGVSTSSTATNPVLTTVTISPTVMQWTTQGGAPVGIQGPMTVQTNTSTPLIIPGSVVILDAGTTSQENVRVQSVVTSPSTGGKAIQFTAACYYSHNKGATVTLTTLGDRVAGKINLNSAWDLNDPRVFQALCDAQSSNSFSATDVQNIYSQMMTNRMPGDNTVTPAIPAGSPSGKDVPFLGWATGQYGTVGGSPPPPFDGFSIANTFNRVQPGSTDLTERLFQTPYADSNSTNLPPANSSQTQKITHPYTKFELLSKTSNNLTSRSNVFAVWLTVGYFQVMNDTVLPVKLGAEIGKAQGTNVRHRLFAIVDRTNIMTPVNIGVSQVPGIDAGLPINGGPVATLTQAITTSPPMTSVQISALSGAQTVSLQSPPKTIWQYPWSIVASTPAQPFYLTIDPGQQNEETVQVNAVSTNPPSIGIATPFQNPHAAGAGISVFKLIPGNPGPRPGYDAHQETAVVPYMHVIQ
jgi:hypothetical protein